MPEYAIRINNLSKRYNLGERTQRYRTLRDTVVDCCRASVDGVRRGFRNRRKQSEEDRILWALSDVSLDVRPGEIVGVIGRNGAGKSTLLKVLSRITEPTTGYADVYGRVGTLLEVGTGFHNELTGRENIFLNGAILNMKRRQIERQFDAIVDFAEVEKFIDTPVKHYSTGMYLRLAFAVAAHLDPDILFVDEVLAVGDLAFQKKCIGKIGDVARQGRTILFVSHNMGAIRSLCNRGVVLDRGKVYSSGDISSAVSDYHRLIATKEDTDTDNSKAKGFSFGKVAVAGRESCTIDQSEEAEITAELRFYDPVPGFTLLCLLDDMQQRRIFHMRQDSPEFGSGKTWQGRYRLNVKLPALWLEPGLYSLYFKVLLWGQDAAPRHMSDILHLDVSGQCCGWGSMISPRREWSVEHLSPVESLSIEQ